MNSAQKAMIYKDVKEVIGNKMMLLPMLIVPIVFVVIFPVVIFATAELGAGEMGDLKPMLSLLDSSEVFESDVQMLIYLTINYIFPVFFILIPIMTSSILGASSFVGEKERKTLETLLYTPMSIKELFFSKVVSTFVPAYGVTIVSFIVFGIIVNVGGWRYFESLIFPNAKWIITILLISPAVALLGIIFMVIVSARVSTFQEAQQMSGFIVIPVVMLIVGQTTGLFLLNEVILLTIGVAVAVADYFLIKIATRKFTAEKLID